MLPASNLGPSFPNSIYQGLQHHFPHYTSGGESVLPVAELEFPQTIEKKYSQDNLFNNLQAKLKVLEADAKSLYLKTKGADNNFDQVSQSFHQNVFELMDSDQLSESQHEQLEHIVLTYGLSQNMTKLNQQACLAKLAGHNPAHFMNLVAKWASRFDTLSSWSCEWPRKPVVAQWFEYALKNTPVCFPDDLRENIERIVKHYAPLMPLNMDTGYRGLPAGHQWSSLFPGGNSPAVFKVISIESADKNEPDIQKSTALKFKVSFPSARDQGLVQKVTAGQHLAILNLKDISSDFKQNLKTEHENTLSNIKMVDQTETLSKAKYSHYTIASPTAGNDDDTLDFLLRVKRDDAESTSRYLGHLKEGDCGLTALPSSNFTRAPNAQTPCLMFGQGTSASLAMTIISSRMAKITTEKKIEPKLTNYQPMHLVMNYKYRGQQFCAKEMNKFAQNKSNNLKFRALVGEHEFLKPHCQKSESSSKISKISGYLKECKVNVEYVFSEAFNQRHSANSGSVLSDIKTNLNHKVEFLRHPSGSYLTRQLMRERHEFDDIVKLIFNPDTHIFFSGYQNAAETTIESIKKAAAFHGESVQDIENAIIAAQQEGRFHVEGTVASGVTTGYQGN